MSSAAPLPASPAMSGEATAGSAPCGVAISAAVAAMSFSLGWASAAWLTNATSATPATVENLFMESPDMVGGERTTSVRYCEQHLSLRRRSPPRRHTNRADDRYAGS